MKNQDMPANPVDYNTKQGIALECKLEEGSGETKREKAFWQVFSAMSSDKMNSPEDTAVIALAYVNAGFKALENDDE